MTAEEFVEQWNKEHGSQYSRYDVNFRFMVEFAKLHVEAALKAAAERAIVTYTNGFSSNGEFYHGNIVSEESILKAYPPDNIK